jgi:hypothetical protein
MNKEKLIGLIIKKETYKDTRPIQNDISKKKEYAFYLYIDRLSLFRFLQFIKFLKMIIMQRLNFMLSE